MISLVLTVPAAVLLDLIIGEPRFFPHPVVLIGRAAEACEKLLRKIFSTAKGLFFAGVVLTAVIVSVVYLAAYLIVSAASLFHPYFGIVVEILLLYTTISIKSLHQHASKVAEPLKENNILAAREKLSLLVSRDSENLEEDDIIRGTVESVAENTIDGSVAPLFYAFIGGAPLALAYKAINTLDSMVGYKDEKNVYFGWASARLDDLVNFIPSRLAVAFFLAAAAFYPCGVSGCWKIIKRDARKHTSPNSGIPEAAVAGILGIKLGGTNYYSGLPSHREEIGDCLSSLKISHIYESVRIMYLISLITAAAGVIIHLIIASI